MHARAISIKNPYNLDFEIMLTPVVKEKRLGTALAFVIA
jgi:hypothetical protein